MTVNEALPTSDPHVAAPDDPRPDSATARWARVVRWGAIAIGGWSVALQLVIGEVVPPVLAIGLVFIVAGSFVRTGRRRWSLVVAALAAVAILGNLPPLVDELTHPDSGWAFVPSLFVTLTAVVLTVAGVAAFRRSTASPRPLLIIAAAVMTVGTAGAIVATASVDSDVRQAGDLEVVATGNEFEPTRLVVPAGTNGFWLDNQDGIRHTFSVRDNGFEIDAPGFSQRRGDVDLAPGVYEVFCNVPGHENMEIELLVVEGAEGER